MMALPDIDVVAAAAAAMDAAMAAPAMAAPAAITAPAAMAAPAMAAPAAMAAPFCAIGIISHLCVSARPAGAEPVTIIRGAFGVPVCHWNTPESLRELGCRIIGDQRGEGGDRVAYSIEFIPLSQDARQIEPAGYCMVAGGPNMLLALRAPLYRDTAGTVAETAVLMLADRISIIARGSACGRHRLVTDVGGAASQLELAARFSCGRVLPAALEWAAARVRQHISAFDTFARDIAATKGFPGRLRIHGRSVAGLRDAYAGPAAATLGVIVALKAGSPLYAIVSAGEDLTPLELARACAFWASPLAGPGTPMFAKVAGARGAALPILVRYGPVAYLDILDAAQDPISPEHVWRRGAIDEYRVYVVAPAGSLAVGQAAVASDAIVLLHTASGALAADLTAAYVSRPPVYQMEFSPLGVMRAGGIRMDNALVPGCEGDSLARVANIAAAVAAAAALPYPGIGGGEPRAQAAFDRALIF